MHFYDQVKPLTRMAKEKQDIETGENIDVYLYRGNGHIKKKSLS